MLSSAVSYPANDGFIPQTLAADDGPLDVAVFCTEKVPPLCICAARASCGGESDQRSAIGDQGFRKESP